MVNVARDARSRTTPQLSAEFQQAAKPMVEYLGNSMSQGIDKLQDEFSSFFKEHPQLNSALDKLQEDLTAGKGFEGLQNFFKTLMQDSPTAPANAPSVSNSPSSPAP